MYETAISQSLGLFNKFQWILSERLRHKILWQKLIIIIIFFKYDYFLRIILLAWLLTNHCNMCQISKRSLILFRWCPFKIATSICNTDVLLLQISIFTQAMNAISSIIIIIIIMVIFKCYFSGELIALT